jgi:hypothetical protein
MKRNIEKQIGYDSTVAFEGYDAKISESDMNKLWDLLQDPYKNPVGAIVREYVSNSFDSHAEAKFIKENSIEDIRNEYSIYKQYDDAYIEELKSFMQVYDEDAVKVTIGKDDTGYFWATEDFGVGLSPERVRDVFCSYLKSTKEDTNNLIGAFGIGSKSGLSYTDVVYIRTRYNGYESFYLLRKGERSPRLDIVYKEPTTERNGTEIKIYIKNYKPYSWSNNEQPETHIFREECRKQLAYFDNVYFVGCDITNDYNVFEGDNWKYSTNGNPFEGLHLCLGKVAYPIDYDSLGISRIQLGVALKFNIGELDIIQTREDVKYTPRTKEAILNKIEELKEELIARWKKDNEYETEDLLLHLVERKSPYSLKFPKFKLSLELLIEAEKLPDRKFLPFDRINLNIDTLSNNNVFLDFNVPSYINRSGLKYCQLGVFDVLEKRSSLYRIEGNHDSKKSKYIFQELENGDLYYFIRKNTPNLKNYKNFLKLKDYPKKEWRNIIDTFQKEVKKALIKNTKSYANVSISPEWLKNLRKTPSSRDNTEFNIHTFYRSSYYNYGYPQQKVKKDSFLKNKHLLVIGLKEDKEWLTKIGDFLTDSKVISSKHFKVFFTAASNVKYFHGVKNVINPVNYMENRIFIKACTVSYIINSGCFPLLNKILYEKALYQIAMDTINKQISRNINDFALLVSKYGKGHSFKDSNSILFDVFDYVRDNDLWDKDILEKANIIEDFFKYVPLITELKRETITSDNLALAFYRFNKSTNKKYWKKINPMYYVNLNEQELTWLSEIEKEKYQSLKLL